MTAPTSGSPLFVLARDRDAWASIRGFVYQVDLSILRWLQLPDTEVLELERGEDIDHLTAGLVGDAATAGRLLEQVKHRTASITLRSSAARETLANFAEHRRENPTTTLRLRFTTTAQIGREQKNPIPGRVPGITAWQGITQATIKESQQAIVLEGIRALLSSAERPDTVPSHVWAAYQDWLTAANGEAFLDFVRSVEWATAMPDSESLLPVIIEGLRCECPSLHEEELRERYQRLFASVFSRLTRPGIKRLTRANLLVELSSSTHVDHILVERLRTLHDTLAMRVNNLEQRMDAMYADLTSTKIDVVALSTQFVTSQLGVAPGSHAAQHGAITSVDPTRVLLPPLGEPPFATYGSSREETVRTLLSRGKKVGLSPDVIALHGANASGKTQLALRIAHALGTRRVWIPFFGLTSEQAGARLAIVVHTLAAKADATNRSQSDPSWEHACATTVRALDVVVLDDIAAFRSGDAFGSRFHGLLDAARATSTVIVLTSVTKIGGLQTHSDATRVINVVVPSLTTNEVAEVLQLRGAPVPIVDSGAPALLCQSTNGHPVLVQAIADYLQRNNWEFTSQVLADVFGQQYATAVNEQTVRALLETVSDTATREYLYRLAITDLEFEIGDADVLAKVPPPIDRARERFTSVVGPWVEPVGNDRYRLSQLIRTLGTTDLLPETRRSCHRVIGERILARHQLNELDALQALTHFIGSDDFDRAALIMLQGLHALVQTKEVPVRTLRLWRSLIVAPQASVLLRLQVHAFQAVLSQRAGESPESEVTAMEQILASDTSVPAWAVFASSLTIVQGLAFNNVPVAAVFMRRALDAWTRVPEDLSQSLRVRRKNINIGIESIIWLVSGGIRSETDLRAWLDTLAELPHDLRESALNTSLARQMAGAILHRILLAEWERPADSRNWHRTADIFAETAQRSQMLPAPALEAAAISSQVTTLHEAHDEIAAISVVAERGLARFSGDPDNAFLIARHMAFGALDRGETVIALGWLRKANAIPGTLHRFDRAHVELRLAQVLINEAPTEALNHADRAVMFARATGDSLFDDVAPSEDGEETLGAPSAHEDNEDRLSPLLIQALGEKAIAQWLTGDRRGASTTILEALTNLVDRGPTEDQTWQTLTVRIGHVTGYFSTTLMTGAPPTVTDDGSPYTAPQMGMLLGPTNAAVAAFYAPSKTLILGIHAMWIADAMDNDVEAVQIAERTVTALKARGLWIAATMPLERLIRHAVERGAFDAAFDYATDMLTAFWLQRNRPRELESVLQSMAPPRDIVGVRSDVETREFDALLLDHVLLPAFIDVARIWTRDRNDGVDRAQALRAVCAAHGKEPGPSELWPITIRLLDMAFIAPAGAQALVDFGDSFGNSDLRTLAVLAYLAASLDERITPRNALYLQFRVVYYIVLKLDLGAHTKERIGTPFFEIFWRTVFERARFRFRSPAVVAADLESFVDVSPGPRLKRLFRLMAGALDVPVPPDMKEWLEKLD